MAAGKSAIDDISHFKAAIPSFPIDNPLATGRGTMTYFGAREFSHERQVGIPLVVNTIRNGRWRAKRYSMPKVRVPGVI
jgi:hypothetical protein